MYVCAYGLKRSLRYGEIMNIELIRDKSTGKSKGFAFLQYEDQRSTVLAVDNLNGSKVIILVERIYARRQSTYIAIRCWIGHCEWIILGVQSRVE